MDSAPNGFSEGRWRRCRPTRGRLEALRPSPRILEGRLRARELKRGRHSLRNPGEERAGADYGAQGIRVNAILPGITLTPMVMRMSETPALAEMFSRARTRHTMERFGQPREIGEAAKWLLSDGASFVNGAAIAVDGGYLSI